MLLVIKNKRKLPKRPRKTVLRSTFNLISKVRKAAQIKLTVNNLDRAWRRNKLSNIHPLDWPELSYTIAKWLRFRHKGLKRHTLIRDLRYWVKKRKDYSN